MTTVSDLIDQGLRDGNLIPVGNSPTPAEQTEALARFNNIVQSLMGSEGGQYLRNWPVPPNRTADVAAQYPLEPRDRDLDSREWPYPPSNAIIYAAVTSETTVYLDGYPQDGARMSFADVGMTANLIIDGNGKLIEGATTKTMTPSDTSPRNWFYRGDLGDWKYIPVTFVLTDESPLHPEFDDLLVTALSIRLSSRYSKDPRQGTVLTYRDSLGRFKTRLWQPTPEQVGSPLGRRRSSYGSDIVTGRTG